MSVFPTNIFERIQQKGNRTIGRVDWNDFLDRKILEGSGRNHSITRLFGYLLSKQMHPAIAMRLTLAFNNTNCVPPLPENETHKIFESILSRECKKLSQRGRL